MGSLGAGVIWEGFLEAAVSRGSCQGSCVSNDVCVHSRSVVSNSVTPWTVAPQAPLPMGFFRQEYWSGLPFPSPADLPDTGIEPMSSALQTYFFYFPIEEDHE